jgi:hypothetical protein
MITRNPVLCRPFVSYYELRRALARLGHRFDTINFGHT